jgi:hypothetical protein
MRNRVTLSFMAVVVVATLMVGLFGCQVMKNHELAVQGKQAHDGLCVLRASAAEQLKRNEAYLERKGDPIVVFGLKIPRATLANSVASQRRTVNALSNLDCQPKEPS